MWSVKTGRFGFAVIWTRRAGRCFRRMAEGEAVMAEGFGAEIKGFRRFPVPFAKKPELDAQRCGKDFH